MATASSAAEIVEIKGNNFTPDNTAIITTKQPKNLSTFTPPYPPLHDPNQSKNPNKVNTNIVMIVNDDLLL